MTTCPVKPSIDAKQAGQTQNAAPVTGAAFDIHGDRDQDASNAFSRT